MSSLVPVNELEPATATSTVEAPGADADVASAEPVARVARPPVMRTIPAGLSDRPQVHHGDANTGGGHRTDKNDDDRQPPKGRTPRVLAIASGGGHWIQLSRIMSEFKEVDVAFVTTLRGYQHSVGDRRFYVIRDGNRNRPISCFVSIFQLLWVLLRERPDVVITTGAACGYLALRIARWFGVKTVWVDSIANANQLSRSGQMVKPYADLWLTQWPELARPDGPHFRGSIL